MTTPVDGNTVKNVTAGWRGDYNTVIPAET